MRGCLLFFLNNSDSNTGHTDCTTGGELARSTCIWHRIHPRGRGYVFLSHHEDTMGASFSAKVVHRPARNLWRPPTALVDTPERRSRFSRWKLDQQHHAFIEQQQQLERRNPETDAARPPVKLKVTRAHGTADLARLEHALAQTHHHLEHRHHLHDLGHSDADGQDAAHRS